MKRCLTGDHKQQVVKNGVCKTWWRNGGRAENACLGFCIYEQHEETILFSILKLL
jgi:hypothetical protein